MVRKQTQVLKFARLWRMSYKSQSLVTLASQRIGATDAPCVGCAPLPDPDVALANKLINECSKAGDLVTARRLFDGMPQRDVVSWNSIMAAYARNDRCDEVLRIFLEMCGCGLRPSHTSISTALSACAKLRALAPGKQIHALSIKLCSSSNVFVSSSLITMYAKCKVFDCLIRVFEDIDRPNLASWNSLLSGFVLNHRIRDARDVFDRMPERNVVSWTAMITGYIEAKKVRIAYELFYSMPAKNVVTWCVMLGGLVSDGQYEEAIKFFTKMMNGVQATEASVVKVISACSRLKNIKQGRKIHGFVIKCGFQLDQSVEASLVLLYCECLNIDEAKLEFDKMEVRFIGSWNSLICGYIGYDKVDEARKLFDSMDERDKISWNSMINGYLGSNRIDDAVELFLKMTEPTMESTTALMSSFIENGRLDEAEKLFNMSDQVDVMTYTTLISGYIKEGLLGNAFKLFKMMPERSLVTYNVMVSGLLQHGKITEAYELFNESPEYDATSWDVLITGLVQNGLYGKAFLLHSKMMLSDISSSELVISSLLCASSKLSLLIHGQQVHTLAIKLGHGSCLVVGNSLINMYCKCGDVLKAKSIFDQMLERDVVTWNVMIYGYAFNGLGKDAIDAFESMKNLKLKPDDVTFVGVLSACNHMCLLEEAQNYFNSMRYHYGITPRLTHYACMIDLLCRMGMVETAERLVSSMPLEPDSVIWTSLLSGCRSTCNIKLAKHAVDQLVAYDQGDPMPYLQLMSVYRSAGRWVDMRDLKCEIDKLGSNKQPGCSWI